MGREIRCYKSCAVCFRYIVEVWLNSVRMVIKQANIVVANHFFSRS
ncbi:MAG: hypothetical protein ACRCUU_05225 [Plesiomonas sp.]